ncbi:MAG: ATP-binding cassette domain-containing protein [Desulfobacteraceae bacterium]|nr:ATP-binding cassette domain-containing protein [Desulfobacteraceae bacterium]
MPQTFKGQRAFNSSFGVVGESGCGKSTLPRLITMIERPTFRDFEVDVINAVTSGPSAMKELRSKVQIVFQDPYGF